MMATVAVCTGLLFGAAEGTLDARVPDARPRCVALYAGDEVVLEPASPGAALTVVQPSGESLVGYSAMSVTFDGKDDGKGFELTGGAAPGLCIHTIAAWSLQSDRVWRSCRRAEAVNRSSQCRLSRHA